MQNITLILEGGALRSLYTSGVLDVLMKYNIEAKTVMGVSAGALTGMNYVSKQPKRTAKINLENCDNSNYIGLKALRKEKGLIGYNYLFNDISKKLYPFDFETFKNSKQKFISVVTNCEEGKTEYVEKSDCKNDLNEVFKVVQASSSMPLCSKMVKIGNNHYLDGAVTMPIPVDYAIKNNYSNIVVVLTRDRNYRKPEVSKRMKALYKHIYGKYPKLVEKLCTMPERYNKIKEEINYLEKENKILVIAPDKPVNVSRLEKDKEKLQALYEDGIKDAERVIEKILNID
jgi:predicted patatin/cPLA2 family phospholipase